MSVSINYHREGEGPPLVLLHGIGHHWQAWEPVIELLVDEFDVIACDSPGFGRSARATRVGSSRRSSRTSTRSSGSSRSSASSARTWPATRWAARSRWSSRADARFSSVTAFSPAGFWTPAELRFCQLSLRLSAEVPGALRPAVEALARTRRGRIALFSQTFGYPSAPARGGGGGHASRRLGRTRIWPRT